MYNLNRIERLAILDTYTSKTNNVVDESEDESENEANTSNEIIKPIFADNLYRIRKERKLTQAELAEQAKVSTTIISDYENARKSPSIGYALSIAEALDTSLDELCGRNSATQYRKDITKDPVFALLTVLDIFKFHTHLLDDGSINLSMPDDYAGYSSTEIKKFFKEYEMIEEFANNNVDSTSGEEMKEKLILHIQEKFKHLPDFPVYQFPKKKSR